MKNLPLLLGTVIGSVVIIVVVALLFANSSPAPSGTTVDQNTLTANALHVTGPAGAPVTIVEFSDFQCPSCRAAQPAIKQVLEQYSEQVRLVYRHYPLPQFTNSRQASYAALAAQDAGLFWEYQELLYARQDEWSTITDRDSLKATLIAYAVELGIDSEAFTAKMETTEVAEQVQADAQIGREIGVSATPTIFVNGVQSPAPQLLSAVQGILGSSGSEE